MTLATAIARAAAGRDLARDEIAEAFGEIMDGAASPEQIRALLVALRDKGETVDELVGAAMAMRQRAAPLACAQIERSIDTCGTGGDGVGTVNISTLAALVIAGCGKLVTKHGNRALSSKCGSADVLEELGIPVDLEPAHVTRCFEHAGIGFAFAPRFHTATRHASAPRREIGTRTIFNLLGPLTNPAGARHQVVGVFDRKWCEPVAAALGALGVKRAAVVHGAGGIDEVAVRGETFVAVWDDGELRTFTLTPVDFGLRDVDPAGLAGGDAAFNADVLRRVLANRDVKPREPLEAVLNAAEMTAALGLTLFEPKPVRLDREALSWQVSRAHASVTEGHATLALYKWHVVANAAPGAELSSLRGAEPDQLAGKLPRFAKRP